MMRWVRIPRDAAKAASWGPKASAPGSDRSERTATETPSLCPAVSRAGAPDAQVVQGAGQLPGVDGRGLVLGQQFHPSRCVGRVADGDRGQDGNPDGIRYLVALPQSPVAPADREYADHSERGANQEAQRPENGDGNGQRSPGSG